MTSTLPPPEDRFHQNVLALTELVHDIVINVHERGFEIVNPNLIGLVNGFLKGYNKTKLIRSFITYSYPHWDQIRIRDSHFFDKNAMEIFRDLPINNVDAFKSLYTLKDKNGNDVIADDDREAVWDFFHSLVKIGIKYIHQGRQPAIRTDTHGVKKPIYVAHFFDEIELEKHAKLWNVELEFSR